MMFLFAGGSAVRAVRHARVVVQHREVFMRVGALGSALIGAVFVSAMPVSGQAGQAVGPGTALLNLRFDPSGLPRTTGANDLFASLLAGPGRESVPGLALWSESGLPYGPQDMWALITGRDPFVASLALLRFEHATGHEWAGVLRVRNEARQVRLDASACPQREAPEFVACALAQLTAPAAPAPQHVVPEPVTLLLVGTGLLGVGGAARRRRRREGAAVDG
jgi:hypothetical protein